MSKNNLIRVGVGAASLLCLAFQSLPAVQMAPATAQDIEHALGRDAKGLQIAQDSLPDLFTLTAKRLEENPEKFIVEVPYRTGPWKGGKAVIEYARDLSYTVVSIYDKDGERQRIYSVRSEVSVDVMKRQALASISKSVQPLPIPESSSKPSAEGAQVPQAKNVEQSVLFEWDDAKNAYVPVTVSAANSYAPAPAAPIPPSASTIPQQKIEPVRPPQRSQPYHPKVVEKVPELTSDQSKAQAPALVPAKIKVAGVTWVERLPQVDSETPLSQKRKHKNPESNQKPTPATVVLDSSTTPQGLLASSTLSEEPAIVQRSTPAALSPVYTSAAIAEPKLTREARVSTKAVELVASPTVPLVPQEPLNTAMLPKPVSVEAPVDELMNSSSQSTPSVPQESGPWVSKKEKWPKPKVDIDSDVLRLRAQENQEAAQRQASEEDALSINSFEKSLGPMYGRHRQYERHFIAGKNRSVKVPDHDFYVDEVDRRKGIHNVYYYAHQTDKAPKLVALERHMKVSFTRDYEIDKEDQGKITTYH